MISFTVNGQQASVADDERLNVIQGAKRVGVEIPHYCWHPALSVVASCRMCLVEVGERKPDGSTAMQPRVVPACQTPLRDGTVVVTNSKKVKDAQAATLEYLLLNHPLDCPTCDQAGECFLQDYSFRYGKPQTRLREPKILRDDKSHIGEHITLFTDRCVMCSRCVRFTREVSGTAELQIIQRGNHAEIDVFPGHPCDNKLAGNVVDLCPVGALCSKDFLYKQRVWWLKSRDSVCPNCSTGCSIHVDQNEEHVYRLRPRPNPKAQGHFMCDDGRFGFGYIHSPDRLAEPSIRQSGGANGNGRRMAGWSAILAEVKNTIAQAVAERPDSVAAVFSPWMTCEEAYLLASWLKSLSPAIQLTMGPITVVGEDDSYPKDVHGKAKSPATFVIRAEKCPNRKGVEAVLAHFQPIRTELGAVLQSARSGQLSVAYVINAAPESGLSVEDIDALGNAKCLIVQDMLESPLTTAADVLLPAASFAEKDGSFVNHKGLAQAIHRSIVAPAEGWTDGRVFQELAGRVGLFNARRVREEMAGQIAYFAPFKAGELGETGVLLEAPA